MKTKARSTKRPRLSIQDRIGAKAEQLSLPHYPLDKQGSTHYVLGFEVNDKNQLVMLLDTGSIPIPELTEVKATCIKIGDKYQHFCNMSGEMIGSLIGKQILVEEVQVYKTYKFYQLAIIN